MKANAPIDAKDKEGDTSLIYAINIQSESVIQILLDSKADINTSNLAGFTPLHIAVQKQCIVTVRKLLKSKQKPHIDAQDSQNGMTPLMYAAFADSKAIANQLLKASADVNIRDIRNGNTALMYAMFTKTGSTINLLIAASADIQLTNHRGETVLSSAEKVIKNIASTKEDKMAGPPPLCLAASLGKNKAVRRLIEAKANIEEKDQEGRTPLYLAAQTGHSNTVELLLSHSADFHAIDQRGVTPLFAAAKAGQFVVVEKLLEAKVAPFFRDSRFKIIRYISVDTHKAILEKFEQARSDILDRRRHARLCPSNETVAATEDLAVTMTTPKPLTGLAFTKEKLKENGMDDAKAHQRAVKEKKEMKAKGKMQHTPRFFSQDHQEVKLGTFFNGISLKELIKNNRVKQLSDIAYVLLPDEGLEGFQILQSELERFKSAKAALTVCKDTHNRGFKQLHRVTQGSSFITFDDRATQPINNETIKRKFYEYTVQGTGARVVFQAITPDRDSGVGKIYVATGHLDERDHDDDGITELSSVYLKVRTKVPQIKDVVENAEAVESETFFGCLFDLRR